MTKTDAIKQILGRPYYENRYGLIYNMDCMAAMAQLPSELVNMTVTSPPYNIGKEYEEVKSSNYYIDWLSAVFSEVSRLITHNGSLLLNLGYMRIVDRGHAIPISYLLWDRIDMYFQQEIVWNYGAGVACRNYLSPRNEKICWYVKNPDDYTFNLDDIRDPNVLYPNQKKNGRLRCNTIGKNPSDVWQIAKVTSGEKRSSAERTNHPAQFPEDLVKRMVKGFSNDDELLLDPFMGSGTVASVAMSCGRQFLGFEINPDYCAIAANRLEMRLADIDTNNFFTAI